MRPAYRKNFGRCKFGYPSHLTQHFTQLGQGIGRGVEREPKSGIRNRLTARLAPEALDAWPRHHVLILASPRTRGMSAASFANFMAEAIEQAGLPERCVLHGLRKAGCRKLAEAGCTTKQIQAISGHKTLSEVERYTRAAQQRGLAAAAISQLAGTKVVTRFPKLEGDEELTPKSLGKSGS